MGLFNKLKNMITGGGAKISLEVLSQPVRGETFDVRIRAEVGDSDLVVRKVYVRVIGEEEVRVPNVEIASRFNDEIRAATETVSRTSHTFDATFDAAPSQTLSARQHYQWDITLGVPGDAPPVYFGQLARHEWKIMAALDVSGNDPDSGWFALPMA